MITKNFKNILATLLCRINTAYGFLPVVATNGTTYYNAISTNTGNFPLSVPIDSLTTSDNNTGIAVGTDNTPATENDYNLKARITSGITASVNSVVSVDASGNPNIVYTLLVNNASSNDITIREIGYIQPVQAATAPGGKSISGRPILIDRTVLDTPVTVPANDSAAIRYTLKTVLQSS